MDAEQQVSLPTELVNKAEKRAARLGLSIEEYIQGLITHDMQQGQHDAWQQPVPDAVIDQWEEDIHEFDEQEKNHPRQTAHSAEELIDLLDEEAHRLERDEDN